MKSVLIIGAKSDISIHLIDKFAKNNFNLLLAGRNIKTLSSIKDKYEKKYSIKCHLIELDILQIEKHTSFLKQLKKLNKLLPEVTISLVGYMSGKKNSAITHSESVKEMLTNYVGPSILLELIAKETAMSNLKSTIIGVSSVAGDRGRASNYIYGSSKAGFTQFLSGLRQKYFNSNIHVITVVPGYIDTKMTKDINTPKIITSTAKDVAELIFSSYINKKNIVYTRYWMIIMKLIKLVPEFIFKKIIL